MVQQNSIRVYANPSDGGERFLIIIIMYSFSWTIGQNNNTNSHNPNTFEGDYTY